MKKILLFLPLLVVLMISSCDNEPCKGVECVKGECVDGTCVCDTCENGTCTTGDCECFEGFQGDNCDVEIREKFIGNWSGELDCSGICIFAPDLCGTEINLTISKDEDNISKVMISAPDTEFDVFGNGTLGSDNETIDLDERQLEIMGIAAVVNGDIVQESEDEIKVRLVISASILPTTIDCPITFTRQ